MSNARNERLAALPTIQQRAHQWAIETYDDCVGSLTHDVVVGSMILFAEAEIARLTHRPVHNEALGLTVCARCGFVPSKDTETCCRGTMVRVGPREATND